ncbi:MAG: DUF2934 domain-containing protein [Verrucomicrobia bacterium]|nr:DUF2934 domain-containing protein [Verrucomicrobiota bacterium]
MGAITHSIEVSAPLQAVYNQWTRFEEFPRFMRNIDEVRPDGPTKLFWRAKIGGKEKQWEAEITEQVPNERIAWRSVEGTTNRGEVNFVPVSDSTTRVTLRMEYEPEGFIEQVGDALGFPLGQLADDLNRFRELMESGSKAFVPTGQTEPLETPRSTGPAIKEGDTWGVEESTKREALSRDREIPPSAAVTGAVASGRGRTGGDPIAGEADEPHHRHGTIIADTPKPMAIEGSSVEENIETEPGAGTSLRPTYEQIARRAYELYLERGEKPGSPHEDWLAAERELSEKSRGGRGDQDQI